MADENTDETTPVDTEVQSEPDIEAVDTESITEDETSSDETEPDAFDRAYVHQLRQENGKWRQRAQRADELAHRLHTALVAATGRLADPSDLPFDAEHLDDPEALTAAIDALVAGKPHLASRRPSGNIGQGALSESPATVDLAAILRQRT